MDDRAIDRRTAITRTFALLAATSGAGVMSCGTGRGLRPRSCPTHDDQPLAWEPSVARPVAHGFADYRTESQDPVRVRIFYPSARSDGRAVCAPFLVPRGQNQRRLVILLHGQCADADHYKAWSVLPATLARCGFVVAVPDLGFLADPTGPDSAATVAKIQDVIDWMITGWPHRFWMSKPPNVGIVGHSFGALYAGLVANSLPAAAYVSLGGDWSHWTPVATSPLLTMTLPKLAVWPIQDERVSLPDQVWNQVPEPKHRLVLNVGGHWEYVQERPGTCSAGKRLCTINEQLTADFVALFLSRYIPSPNGMPVPDVVAGLRPPPVTLTDTQRDYAHEHMFSFRLIAGQSGCGATLTWDTTGDKGSRALP